VDDLISGVYSRRRSKGPGDLQTSDGHSWAGNDLSYWSIGGDFAMYEENCQPLPEGEAFSVFAEQIADICRLTSSDCSPQSSALYYCQAAAWQASNICRNWSGWLENDTPACCA
jgi:hypothetical protein